MLPFLPQYAVCRAAILWNMGKDTSNIAGELGFSEPIVWKSMERVQNVARVERFRARVCANAAGRRNHVG